MIETQHLSQLVSRIEAVEKILNINVPKTVLPKVLERFDFTQPGNFEERGWDCLNVDILSRENGINAHAKIIEKTLSAFFDPMLVNDDISIDAEQVKTIHVRLKSDVLNARKCCLRVYFTTDKNVEWTQSKSVENKYPAGKMSDVYIPTSNKFWNGIVTKLRIDPVEGLRGNVDIEYVELLDNNDFPVLTYDFTNITTLEGTGWWLKNATVLDTKDCLSVSIDAIDRKRLVTDPVFYNSDINLNTADVKQVHLRFKTDLEKNDAFGENNDLYLQLYFTTSKSENWSQLCSFRYFYEAGEVVDCYIPMKHIFFKGTLTGIRIDPFESFAGSCELQLVELIGEEVKHTFESLNERVGNIEKHVNKV